MQPGLDFSVHPSSGVPIYRQIMDQIVAALVAGRIRPGAALPSIRVLAGQLQVNMMTVSKAYSRLELDGVLERVRGVGMIVAQSPATPDLTVKQRQAELQPLVDQAVLRGRQLQLTDKQIQAVFDSVLQGTSHARASK